METYKKCRVALGAVLGFAAFEAWLLTGLHLWSRKISWPVGVFLGTLIVAYILSFFCWKPPPYIGAKRLWRFQLIIAASCATMQAIIFLLTETTSSFIQFVAWGMWAAICSIFWLEMPVRYPETHHPVGAAGIPGPTGPVSEAGWYTGSPWDQIQSQPSDSTAPGYTIEVMENLGEAPIASIHIGQPPQTLPETPKEEPKPKPKPLPSMKRKIFWKKGD